VAGVTLSGGELLSPRVESAIQRVVKQVRELFSVSHNADGTLKHPIPTGGILRWGGSSSSIPTGWLYCDGSAVSRVTYVDLFHAIGITSGAGDGVNTFTLPNLTGTGTFIILTGA
jgi:hypothetical protein